MDVESGLDVIIGMIEALIEVKSTEKRNDVILSQFIDFKEKLKFVIDETKNENLKNALSSFLNSECDRMSRDV